MFVIRDWDAIYENNRTRDMKKMLWVPIPNGFDGDGYTQIMDRKNGVALYGAWIACVNLASRCAPRGTLLRSTGDPHDCASISRITRVEKPIVEEMLDFCCNTLKWLIYITPQEGAGFPQEGVWKGKEGKGMEEKDIVDRKPSTIPYQKIIERLNEKAGTSYKHTTSKTRDMIKARFNEKFSFDDFVAVIDKKVLDWSTNPDMVKYLRPETLFGNKFEGYLQSCVVSVAKAEKTKEKMTETQKAEDYTAHYLAQIEAGTL